MPCFCVEADTWILEFTEDGAYTETCVTCWLHDQAEERLSRASTPELR